MKSCLLLVYCCLVVNGFSVTTNERFFRSDYIYEPSQNAHYKLHRNNKNWGEARRICSTEGATLAVPENKAEIEIMVRMMNDVLSNATTAANIGIHDLYAEGIYVTADGEEIVLNQDDWLPGEPNNANDREDCVTIQRSGKFMDIICSWKFPFFCKKKDTDIIYNIDCENSDMDYFRDRKTNKCYKLHLEPNTWPKAFEICNFEQSYLAIINSEYEVQILKSKLEEHPAESLPGNFYKDGIHVGFTDLFTEGEYVTIHGETLSKAGYTSWSPQQPDNAGNNENCGHMLRSGLLNDINCTKKLIFFCERDIGRDIDLHEIKTLHSSKYPHVQR